MTVLIIGYPDSGKSAMAEDMAMEMSADGDRIYLATMIPYGEDGAGRIEKHRKMREGKGFITVEAPFDINKAVSELFTAEELLQKTVLLECVSNLTANLLFERKCGPDETIDRVTAEIKELSGRVRNLVIVSNHFEAEDGFDQETLMYADALDKINLRIGKAADTKICL